MIPYLKQHMSQSLTEVERDTLKISTTGLWNAINASCSDVYKSRFRVRKVSLQAAPGAIAEEAVSRVEVIGAPGYFVVRTAEREVGVV